MPLRCEDITCISLKMQVFFIGFSFSYPNPIVASTSASLLKAPSTFRRGKNMKRTPNHLMNEYVLPYPNIFSTKGRWPTTSKHSFV